MKKINLDIWKKRVVGMAPHTYDVVLFFGSIFLLCICEDFSNLNLEYCSRFGSALLLMELVYFCCWFIDCIVYVIVKTYRAKKNKKVIIDNQNNIENKVDSHE